MRYHLDVASPTSAALTNIHHLFHQSLSLGTELKHDIEFSRAARQSKRNMSTYLLSLVPFITLDIKGVLLIPLFFLIVFALLAS